MNTGTWNNWAGRAPAYVENQLSIKSTFPAMDSQQICIAAAQAGHEKDETRGSLIARQLQALKSYGMEYSPALGFVPWWLWQLALFHNQQISDWTTGRNRFQTW